MRLTIFNDSIPEWLKSEINLTCPYCGSYITDNDKLTVRKCCNSACPGHMAQKMDKAAKLLGVKNFGPATALEYIKRYSLKSHIQIVPYLVAGKPALHLWDIGELAMITGMSKRWRELCVKYPSMKSFAESPYAPIEVINNKDFLIYVESFFTVIKPFKGERINIMMSGSFDGYNSRSDYVRSMNAKYGDYVQLIDIGKRKSDCDFLIREKHAVDHEKTRLAKSAGIPILTPSELSEKVEAIVTYITERG
jgi:hypothetical protein